MTPDTGQHLDVRLDRLACRRAGQRARCGYPYSLGEAGAGWNRLEAHRAALERIAQAGAKPISWVQLLCELQRDWVRKETAAKFAEILFAVEGY